MFRIYRIENEQDLLGPHHSSNRISYHGIMFDEAIERHNTLCPLPFNDGLDYYQYEKRLFAVESKEQILKDWTLYEFLSLIGIGYNALEITVHKFISGNVYNIVFEREWILEQRIINQEILKMYEKDCIQRKIC